MSDLEPQVPEEDERDRRKVAWLFWAVPIIVLLGAALGTVGAVGGFSGSPSGGHSPAPAFAPASSVASPTLTQFPDNPTSLNNAHFMWTDATTGVTFRCQLDSGGYGSCKSPTNYNQLADGNHCFYVEAVKGVNTSSPTQYCWTILANKGFIINGDLSLPLYPGTSQSVNLSIYNPNHQAITIPAQPPASTNNVSVVISLGPTATADQKANCSPSANFALTQGLLVSITIPAGATVLLSDHTAEYPSGVPVTDWPVITMYDGNTGPTSHTDQTSCENAPLVFTWSATGSGT